MDQFSVEKKSTTDKKGKKMSRCKKVLIGVGVGILLMVSSFLSNLYLANQATQAPEGNRNPAVTQPAKPSPTVPERTDNIPESEYEGVPITSDVVK
ncbi:hypothetical protein [Shimazuella kribbensis]|uniref:hypothetical protein n=1 Tax=Shimazuella kribbensis TaxID=139808 RepID=UPI0014718B52|nr:hypothetical protein [Shimazuella kribbensis]